MHNIAFFNIPAYGHTNPTLEVVRVLTGRGNNVLYYSFDMFQEKIEAAGAQFRSCDAYLPPLPKDFDRRVGKDFSSLIGMAAYVTLAMGDLVCGQLAEFKPGCIVADSMSLWGKLFAKKLGVPLVCSTTTFAFNDATAKLMKPGFRELLYMITGMPKINKDLKRLRQHGYAAESLVGLIQNDNQTDTIVYTSRAFQPLEETFGETYAFVGPSLPKAAAEPCKKERPLIYVSLGTVNRDLGFYQSCVEALGGGPYDVLLSVGEKNAGLLQAVPANIQVKASVPQLAVLQNADVFITHCGMNSVSESIYFQVPMVLAPQQSEQYAVAQRAQAVGAGLRLPSAAPEAIRVAVAEVLRDKPQYQASLSKLAASFRSAGGAERAADKIEAAAKG